MPGHTLAEGDVEAQALPIRAMKALLVEAIEYRDMIDKALKKGFLLFTNIGTVKVIESVAFY